MSQVCLTPYTLHASPHVPCEYLASPPYTVWVIYVSRPPNLIDLRGLSQEFPISEYYNNVET